MSLNSVETALCDEVIRVLDQLHIPVVGENQRHPGGTTKAQIFFVPTQPYASSIGETGTNRFEGFVQVDLIYPDANGSKPARTDFEAFYDNFKTGLGLSHEDQWVTIKSCGRSQGRFKLGDGYKVSITIYWWADVPR